MLVYPVYALLFAAHGLSPGEISSLLVIWSVTGFVLELPSGVWADLFSRRKLMALSPLLAGAGYALWTFLPSYPAFAVGFVLWGAAGAVRSGAWEALVYEELARLGAEDSYARVIGRAEVASTVAIMLASALAAPVLQAGGYVALGVASVVVPLLTALAGWSLPETRGEPEEEPTFRQVLRSGVAQVRRGPGVRRALLLLVAVYGCTGIDEFLPLLAVEGGASPAGAALLVTVVTAGETAGGWLAGRGLRAERPLLIVAALCLAGGAVTIGRATPAPGFPDGVGGWGTVAGFALVAVAFGIFRWAVVAADTRLQDRIDDTARATVTSLSGLGTETVVVLVYAGYGLGSGWLASWQLFCLAAVPYLILGLVRRS
ncbi:MFS transporter [Nonomuraea sp. NPDC050328]|uniref:MFS transporter n=1 Tax=Nonomuraea sp. NPDC050328 TaxID=3364361 RepID=UPI0037BA3AE0